MVIGFFDSGIGGVTVMQAALKAVKNADFIYYADTKNVPYGTKSKAQVRSYVLEAADFLVRRGVGILVVACNTATSVAIEELRQTYDIPIIGMEPAVKPAVENHKDKRILVTATELALKEDKLKKLITRLDCEDIVDLLPLQDLVGFAENGIFDAEAVTLYLKNQFSQFDMQRYQTLVLGCTHFIYFKPLISALLGPHIDIIDGNAGTVNRLLTTLSTMDIGPEHGGHISWYESGETVADRDKLHKLESLLTRLDAII